MIKTTLGKVIELNEALKRVIETEGINASFKFKMLGITKELETSVTNFEQIRTDKIREFGTEGEDGNYSIDKNDKEAMDNFISVMSELVASPVELKFSKLKASEVFKNIKDIVVLNALYDIMEDK